jgi:hypothetical protein
MPVPDAIWVMQPMLPVAIASGRVRSMLATFRSRAARDLGLEQVVGAGRAAADVALGHVADGEAGLGEQALGLAHDRWPCCIEQAEW